MSDPVQGVPSPAATVAPKKKRLAAKRTPTHAPVAPPVAREAVHAPVHAKPRERKRSRAASMDPNNEYYVNLAAVGPDTDVNWKRFSNVGEEQPFYLAQMREQGWEPVDPREHPDWVPVPDGYDKPNVIKGGLILMERPMDLTRQARAEMEGDAKQQVREAEQRLGRTPEGTLPRNSDGSKTQLVKEIMRPIPIED